MKRLIAFVCVAAIIMGMSGCGNTKKEENIAATTPCILKKENGKFYLVFREASAESVSTENTSAQILCADAPKFSSFSELKNAVETGNFSKENLSILQKRAKNGVLEVPDPSKFCDAVLPAGLKAKEVYWDITSYSIGTSWGDNNYDSGGIIIDLDGEHYDYYFNQNIINYADAADTVISDRNIEDRKAHEFIYTNKAGKYKKLLYQIEDGERILYVRELYCMDYYYPELTPSLSETTPQSVHVYCKEDDVSWFIFFYDFEERPTVEWLKSFGIKEVG